jgi:cytochrome b involved in lipid metabolism
MQALFCCCTCGTDADVVSDEERRKRRVSSRRVTPYPDSFQKVSVRDVSLLSSTTASAAPRSFMDAAGDELPPATAPVPDTPPSGSSAPTVRDSEGASAPAVTLRRRQVLEMCNDLDNPQGRHLVIIGKYVYDLKSYLDEHPGGRFILNSYIGRDATSAFADVGHSVYARNKRNTFRYAKLLEDEEGEGSKEPLTATSSNFIASSTTGITRKD